MTRLTRAVRLLFAAAWAAVASRRGGRTPLEHLARGKGQEFGVAAITGILACARHGVKLIGLLPAETQNTTARTVTLLRDTPAADAARVFVDCYATAAARARFAAAGIE